VTTDFALPAAVFTCVALATGCTMSLIVRRWSPERRRLAALVQGRPSGAQPILLVDDPSATVARLAQLRCRSPERQALLRRRLRAAGYGPNTVNVYTAIETGCTVVGAVLPLLLLGWRGVIFSAIGIAAGMLTPRIALTRHIEHRRAAIRHGLPDALDLLVVCLDAGCTLSAAIGKVSEELRFTHPALAHELAALRADIQAGKPRIEAFQHLADRTQVDEIRPLVTLLLQAERFGTAVNFALRTHAASARDRRSQRAEELASKAGIKMVFPLVLCIFPAFYVVTLGPVIIHFVRLFFDAGVLHF
jgi:tight adherence protein C